MTTAPVRIPWKQVPVPERIDLLPRDRRGFPVPWVSCWTGNTILPAVRRVPLTEHGYAVDFPTAVCNHVAGQGEPNLAQLCPGNQVRGMLERLCDACGQHVPEDDPIYFLGQMTNPWFRECGLHLECAVYSLLVCPGLSTKPGVGVHIAQTYALTQPGFFAPDERGKVVDVQFDTMDEAVLSMAGTASVLVHIDAVPDRPLVMSREDFLADSQHVLGL